MSMTDLFNIITEASGLNPCYSGICSVRFQGVDLENEDGS